MTRPRFLTSSLATAAIAASLTLAAPSAYAAEAPQCGLAPTTVTHPAVPATYAVEKRWTLTSPGTVTTSDWLRTPPEGDGWTQVDQKTVIDQAAVAPTTKIVTVVLTEAYDATVVDVPEHYVHHDAVTEQRQVLDQPAWDETTIDLGSEAPYAFKDKQGHVKYLDTPVWNGGDDITHDQGWNRFEAGDKTTVTHHPATYKTVTVVVKEAYDEFVETTYKTEHFEAVTEERTVEVPGTDAVTHDEFRYQRVVGGGVEDTWATVSPGAEWVDTGDTRQGDQLTAGSGAWTETIPGTDPCPEETDPGTTDPGTTDPGTTDPGDGGNTGGNSGGDTGGNTGGGSEIIEPPAQHPVAGDQDTNAAPKPEHSKTITVAPTAQVAAPAPQAAAPVTTSTLPNTGGVSLVTAGSGLGAVLLGAFMMLLGRRRRFDAS